LYYLQRQVNRLLADIRQPILIIQGKRDAVIDPQAPVLLEEGVSSADTEVLWLENSGHNLLVDGQREYVWQRSYAWMAERSAVSEEG
jgi:carboxylesterase